MRDTNYMIFSRETIEEILEDYVKRNYGWNVSVKFQQRKHHNVAMFEAKLSKEQNERDSSNEE